MPRIAIPFASTAKAHHIGSTAGNNAIARDTFLGG
jgi:hypothetical protein